MELTVTYFLIPKTDSGLLLPGLYYIL